MESRKVQQVGYSTLSVSLPRSWVKDIGLKQGDQVTFLPERNGSLKLMPSALVEHKAEVEEFVINSDVCNEPNMLERIIVGSYILGRDVIKIVSSKRIRSTHVEEVRRILRRLIGLGIIEETPNQITIQCSIDPTKFKIDILMRRLCVIASTIHNEAIQALVEFDPELAKDAIRREDEADMVYWLATRLLLSAQRSRAIAEKIGLEEPLQILGFGMILKYLELIADYAENIARTAIELEGYKDRIGKQVMQRISHVSELVNNLFQKAMECVFTADVIIANSLLEIRNTVEEEEERLMRELPEIPHLRATALNLRMMADNGAGIAAIAINRALEKRSKAICSPY